MKYNGIVISDLHWGVLPEDKMWDEYDFIPYFIQHFPLDFIVIAGDYFDFKLYLDSKRTIRALEWFDTIFKIAKESGVKKIRMIRGTISHDADQLMVFRKYESEDGFFRIYEKCTSEELLPRLQCVFCPDEIMSTGEYIFTYIDQLFAQNQLGFFHGNFDIILRKEVELTKCLFGQEEPPTGSITFPYQFFQRLVDYAWIGGHWHDGESYENVIYTGSATRWEHNEYNAKGIGLISVDMDAESYFYCKIENPNAPEYLTYEVHPEDIQEETIRNLIEKIDKKEKYLFEKEIEYKIRIMVYSEQKDLLTDNIVRLLKEHYSNNKNVVVKLKTKSKKQKKEKEVTPVSDLDLSFLKNDSMKFANQLHEFIKKTTNVEIPLEYIERYTTKYMK